MESTAKRREGYKLTFRDVVAIFFYTKRTFIFTFIGVIVGALLVALLSPPVYKVSARLVVKPRIEKPLMFEAESSRVNVADRVDQQVLNTVVYLITSPDVLREVVRRHQLADLNNEQDVLEKLAKLRGQVTAEPLSLSNIIEVQYKGGEPEAVTAELNSLLDAYIAYHIQVNQENKGSLDFFDQQAALYRNKYVELSNKVAETRKHLNLASADIQADNELNVVRDLEARRTDAATRLKATEERLKYLRSAMQNLGSSGFVGVPNALQETYPALVEMERSLAQLIINKQRAESDFLPDSKPVRDADVQYDNMRGQIRSYMGRIIESLVIEVETARKELTAIESSIANAKNSVGQLSADGILLQRLEFERGLAEKNYRLYEDKREEARINDEKDRSQFANVSIASRPLIPVSPWFPQRKLIVLLSIPLALVLALAASIISYSLDQTVRNPTDIYLRTRLRLLGTLDSV